MEHPEKEPDDRDAYEDSKEEGAGTAYQVHVIRFHGLGCAPAP